jgi:RNA polymerase sigma-70 factor (ECF subfamily)
VQLLRQSDLTSSEGCSPLPLAAIVDRACAGDVEAFETLIALHQRKVLSITWRVLGNLEDALDATQECFLRAWRYRRTFQRNRDFAAWLYRIAVHVCCDMQRRPRGLRLVSFEADRGAFETLLSPQDLENDAIQSQAHELVRQALGSLPPRERAALVLRDFEGLATEEVAAILRSRPSTVRSQISSARAKMKRFYLRLIRSPKGR